MPGLSQLKQFSSEMLKLGNEVEIRKARGEKATQVPIPDNVADVDDSSDFKKGLPQSEDNAENAGTTEAASHASDSDDSSPVDIDIPSPDAGGDFDDLLSPGADLNLDDLDFGDFDIPSDDKADTEDNRVSDSSDEKSESDTSDSDDFNFEDLDASVFQNVDDGKEESNGTEDSDIDDFTEPAVSDLTNDVTDDAEGMHNAEVSETEDTDEKHVENASSDDMSDLFMQEDPALDELTAPEIPADVPAEDDSKAETPEEENLDDFNFDMPDFDDIGKDNVISPDMEVPDEVGSDGTDSFDTSAMDDFDKGSELDVGNDDVGATDFELGDFGSKGSDDDELFHIPGFSDTTDSADMDRKEPDVATPDFTGASTSGSKPKNSFTDAEYKKFKKNFEEYPLNVRLAVEDLVVKNEFTDEVVFQILEKILQKVSARTLASDLSKLMDVPIDVPRDYERRSATEYEAYKKSLEYQIKNRILPMAFMSCVAALVVVFFFNIFNYFIYKPLKANSLYKQGYALIQKEQYPQSVDKFNEALTYRPVKKWYYTYADGYRNHRQFDRARLMYKAVLARYNHEKAAGIAWADMEINDTYNYEEAERILKREVLDYYINDSDAMLMLGDMYMDWAESAGDDSKYALAKEQYDLLSELYGNTDKRDTYLARQMRYYIRTDDLRQVLQYKSYFYGKKKGGLGSDDLIELSGYLLDKRYGELRPSEQNLRFVIEDVRSLLEQAVKSDSSNPVALYNMGRYFVETDNINYAVLYFKAAMENFEKQLHRKRSDNYKFINNYRLLGEQYVKQDEYILAEETYGKGLDYFEKIRDESDFDSDENVGKLYADMADLDFFVSGDTEHALTNYINSVNNKNDTSSVRYKIGYIQYNNKNYSEALGSFIKSSENNPNDTHLLLALANTLSLRNDNYAAEGYYEKLINVLESKLALHETILPQVREEQADLVDSYMKATNNLGVTLSRLTEMTGDSQLNARAIVNFQESLRSWDALTRNQTTMMRLDGSNLAKENIEYLISPSSKYRPEIYTQLSRTLDSEDALN